jgi:hypothetical protein
MFSQHKRVGNATDIITIRYDFICAQYGHATYSGPRYAHKKVPSKV